MSICYVRLKGHSHYTREYALPRAHARIRVDSRVSVVMELTENDGLQSAVAQRSALHPL